MEENMNINIVLHFNNNMSNITSNTVVIAIYYSVTPMFPFIIQGQTPLHLTVKNKDEKLCSILLTAGSFVDCTDKNVMF